MEIQEQLTKLGNVVEEFKKTHSNEIKELKEKGFVTAETKEKMEKLNDKITALESNIDLLTKALNRTGNGDQGGEQKSEHEAAIADYKKHVDMYLRKGRAVPQEVIEKAQAARAEFKEMSVDSDVDGGFFVNPEMSSEIVKKVFESSPVRQLAGNVTLGSSDAYEELYDGDEIDSGWVGERQARTVTDTPEIKKIRIPVEEVYAMPKVTQKLLDDAGFDLEGFLQEKAIEKFGRDEATAFVSGNGLNKPKGIIAYADASEGYNKVQVQRTISATALDGDDAIAVQTLLKEPYQANASWLINRLIIGEFRKLKDVNTGQYIWQPGLSVGQPSTLLGRPVYMASDLDSTLAIDKYLAIYGDLKKGYKVVDRTGIRVLRDALTVKGSVLFYMTKRVGGGVSDFDALKILQSKAS